MNLSEPMPIRWRNAFGSAFMFALSLCTVWLMVRLTGMSVETALLIQILWLVCALRWHQPPATFETASEHKP